MDDLTNQIRRGLARLSGGFDVAHAGYVATVQNDDGGWSGRSGASDLYYTSFALRTADVLGFDGQRLWSRAAVQIDSLEPDSDGIIETASLLASDRLLSAHGFGVADQGPRCVSNEDWATRIERYRVDGGYARAGGGPASAYLTFLAALCYELLGLAMPDRGAAVCELLSRQRGDGGFAESGDDKVSGVNPTAAAVSFLAGSDDFTEQMRKRAIGFLNEAQRPDGGFGAHASAPCSDLLSTFTAMAALFSLDADRAMNLAAAARFVRDLAVSGGGFRGGPADERADVEYTYYGVGVVGLLSSVAACRHECDGACPGCPRGEAEDQT